MNALALRSDFAETMSEIFAPIDGPSLKGLLAEYDELRALIASTVQVFAGSARKSLRYFVDGNHSDSRYGSLAIADRLFSEDGAVSALNADFWRRALDLTDVRDCMPQKRIDEWDKMIEERETPDFDQSTVIATLQGLLAQRETFFAERVDGVFKALSGEHVTNSPTGFRKRMILRWVYNGYANTTAAGHIHDLRAVVAKFMGRASPSRWATTPVIKYARENATGQWVEVDGGALKVRVYKNGNGHVEVHPDMAYRLNRVLASLYPSAIASEHRQKPKRRPKNVELIKRPLPFAVLELLSSASFKWDADTTNASKLVMTMQHGYDKKDKHLRAEVSRVIESVGGAPDERAYMTSFDFSYDARNVIRAIVASGCVPDQKTHQYYPTPEKIAARVAELAEITEPETTVLEPSAGTGALINELSAADATVTAVEASELFCGVLRERFGTLGDRVVNEDFLDIEPAELGLFDRVVMNPPFSQGRWQAHLEHAAGFVKEGGRLVAVLPASACGKTDLLPGFDLSWADMFDGEFAGTSVSVVLLVAERVAR